MADILDRAQPLDDEFPYIKLLLHGDAGAGKTHFSSFAPNPVWMDWERSSETLRTIPEKSGTPIFRPKSFAEVREFTRAAPKKYETLVLDTMTTAQIFYMREYMKNAVANSQGRRTNVFDTYQGDYRIATAELTDWFLELQEMPMHVICIAHSNYVLNDDGVLVKIEPQLTMRVRKNLEAFINVIGYLERKSSITGAAERKLYVNPTGIIVAKNRLGIQETSIKDPSFESLFT